MEKKRDERRRTKGQKKRGRLSRRRLIGRMKITETDNAQDSYLHNQSCLRKIPLDGKHGNSGLSNLARMYNAARECDNNIRGPEMAMK